MNDNNLEQRKRACNCDVNELLAKERQYMKSLGIDPNAGGYVFCDKHCLWVSFEWVKAAA